MATDPARTIAEAYRWQRRLGNSQIAAAHCHIVADQAHPDVWDSNHADDVTAQTESEIDSVLAAMDEHLGHTPWRVVHTDCFTPNGAGMIEDLFTLQSARRRGIATAMIAAFATRLRDAGCHTIFVGALATEQPKYIYFRLGFRPVMLTRTWVRKSPKKE